VGRKSEAANECDERNDNLKCGIGLFGGTGTESALPFKEQGAAASFFFGYFLFCGKKESDIHGFGITYWRS
jgi:hypothetical protein